MPAKMHPPGRRCGWYLALAASLVASGAPAADADRGQRLAQTNCSACHGVAIPPREEVAAAPPLQIIAGKYGFDASAIAAAILAPHPRMNFSPAPGDADDIAAYLGTLPR
jgi:mono/diheme cytochrome c family protein